MENNGHFDALGLLGAALHWSLILLFMGIGVVGWFLFWWRGQLAMDEEAKYQMLEERDE